MVFLKEQTETKNGKEYTNYYFYHGNTYLGKAEEGLSTIQANIKDELGETVDPEKIEKLQEQAREKMETEVKGDSGDDMDLDLDLDHWDRAKKRENKSHIAVWEFANDRDVTVEIIEQDDGQEGKYYDVLEKVGGYTEHEIATALMDVEKAIEEAERAMLTANENQAEMADSGYAYEKFEPDISDEMVEDAQDVSVKNWEWVNPSYDYTYSEQDEGIARWEHVENDENIVQITTHTENAGAEAGSGRDQKFVTEIFVDIPGKISRRKFDSFSSALNRAEKWMESHEPGEFDTFSDSGTQYELSDHEYWERREDLENTGQRYVWENTEDEGITVEVEYDGEKFDAFEKHGGFTDNEIVTGTSEVEALRLANRRMERIADKQRKNLRDSGKDYEMSDSEDNWFRRKEYEDDRFPYVWENHVTEETVWVRSSIDGFDVTLGHPEDAGITTKFIQKDSIRSKEDAKDIAEDWMEDNQEPREFENELSDIEAKPPEIGDEFYHVRVRDPSRYETERVPDWASDVASSVSNGSKVKMGKLGQGDWEVQSVMIKKSNVDRNKAKELAERIAKKVDGSDSEMSDVDRLDASNEELAEMFREHWRSRPELWEIEPEGDGITVTFKGTGDNFIFGTYRHEAGIEYVEYILQGDAYEKIDGETQSLQSNKRNWNLDKTFDMFMSDVSSYQQKFADNSEMSDSGNPRTMSQLKEYAENNGWSVERYSVMPRNSYDRLLVEKNGVELNLEQETYYTNYDYYIEKNGDTVKTFSTGVSGDYNKSDVVKKMRQLMDLHEDGDISLSDHKSDFSVKSSELKDPGVEVSAGDFIVWNSGGTVEEVKSVSGDSIKLELIRDPNGQDGIHDIGDTYSIDHEDIREKKGEYRIKDTYSMMSDSGKAISDVEEGDIIHWKSGGTIEKVMSVSGDSIKLQLIRDPNGEDGIHDPGDTYSIDHEDLKEKSSEFKILDSEDSMLEDSDTDIFAGDEFADRIANSELIYQDWDDDNVANIDDRSPLEPGDAEEERVNEEILLSEELKNIEELSENHREVYEMLKDEVDIHKGRVKQPESILKKLHEKYSEEVTDIIGVTIMADDKDEVMQVAQELKDRHALYPIGEERADENHYEEDGFYRAYHLIIEVEHDGEKYPAEVQIKTEEQAKLHELAHEYYKRNEDMPELLEEKARKLENGEIDSVDVDELKKKLP